MEASSNWVLLPIWDPQIADLTANLVKHLGKLIYVSVYHPFEILSSFCF